jgi:predicted 3-demethylubiquinone-9 3-methyltransferase (glyoxalase superfamily)
MQKIVTNLWFDTQAEEAAKFYISVFKNSKILEISHYTEAGPGVPGSVLTVKFSLDGQEFIGINGGPEFKFTEAISLMIYCEDQAEIDYFWEKLTADGGEESVCGWLKDKYGLSWQVVPRSMDQMMLDPDRAKVNRVMDAMLQMKKIDIAALEQAAAQGQPA